MRLSITDDSADRDGRVCANIASLGNASCCVPCPLQELLYSDNFGTNVDTALWIGVSTFIFQVFLMLSFWILPSKEGHGHYLNWGLTISVALLAVSELREEGAEDRGIG